ncbi:MAG: carbohydrate ABC transporter permease [Anaeroplasmataceae bacterium]|nr:carbohydrate ABC transporter permease [Anaeroplasmataceae bacterium]
MKSHSSTSANQRASLSKFKKKITADYILGIVNNVLLIILSLFMIYPIFYLFISAVSNPIDFREAVNANKFLIIPQGFTMEYIMDHLKNLDIWRAYGNTVLYTLLGTAISLFLSITCAYVLSRRGLKIIKVFTIIVVLTMWLKPGMIATYTNIDNLGLMGNMFGILIPFAFSAYNVILLRTYFAAIPVDIDESAQIDGASHFRMLTSIYIPASGPAITTVGLFYAIDRWNGYFWAELVLQKDKLYPLQVLVKKLLQQTGDSGNLFEGTVSAYALIIIAIVPIMLIFPFIHKYFKKGVMVGSVK